MKQAAHSARTFYVAGGTMEADAESYIFRPADQILHDSVVAGEYCQVLASRQMGKSSLLARTRERLIAEGIRVSNFELTKVGLQQGEHRDAEHWYRALASLIHDGLDLDFPLAQWWKERADLTALLRLMLFFEQTAASLPCPAAIFLDEVETMAQLPFSDDFFAGIRVCYNERSTNPLLKKITFVLAGVTTPLQLIRDPARTPYNIGRAIELADFTLDQALPLARLLDPDDSRQRALLGRVLYWTDGHPYLTQIVCRDLGGGNGGGLTDADVDASVAKLFLSSKADESETNLKVTGDRLKQGRAELMRMYRRVRAGEKIADRPAHRLYMELKLTGAVKVDEQGNLRVRNRVYETVFSPEWIKPHLKQPVWKTAATATAVVFALTLSVWTLKRQNQVDHQAATLWESTARNQLAQGNRDAALLAWLEAARAEDSVDRRREIQHLIGRDYERLVATVRSGPFVDSVAFTPDGKFLAVGDSAPGFRLWGARDGRPLDRWAHPGGVSAIAICARANLIATAGPSGTVQVSQLGDGRQAGPTLPHEGAVRALSFNPEGSILASGGDDGVVRLWDARTGRLITALDRRGRVQAIAFSPGGETVVAGTQNDVVMWRVTDGKSLGAFTSIGTEASALAYSPDGSTVLVAGDGARLWRVSDRQAVGRQVLAGIRVGAAAFAPDGKSFITGSRFGAQRWRVAGSEPIGSPFRTELTQAVAFSPDGAHVVTGGFDGTARVWEVESSVQKSLVEHSGPVLTSSFSSDGRMIASGSMDGIVKTWNLPDGGLAGPPIQLAGPVRSIAFKPGVDPALLIGSMGKTTQSWGVKDGQPTQPPIAVGDAPSSISVSPDGDTEVIIGDSGLVDIRRGTVQVSLRPWVGFGMPGAPAPVEPVIRSAFAPDGKTLAVGDRNGRLTVQRVSIDSGISPLPISAFPELRFESMNSRRVGAVGFRFDQKSLLVFNDKMVYRYVLDGGTVKADRVHLTPYPVVAVHFPMGCDDCYLAAMLVGSNGVAVQRLTWTLSDVDPIQGDITKLAKEWARKLALRPTPDGKFEPVFAQ